MTHVGRHQLPGLSACHLTLASCGGVQAAALGLSNAITAAKAHVQSRKAQLTAKIHAANSAGDTAQLSALQEDAGNLGMGNALRALQDALHARARAAEGRLETAARTADQQAFDACLQARLPTTPHGNPPGCCKRLAQLLM